MPKKVLLVPAVVAMVVVVLESAATCRLPLQPGRNTVALTRWPSQPREKVP
jgi:hypothetical protein